MLDKEILLKKLVKLRKRIEAWTDVNGFGNQSNQSERKNKDGEVVWKRTDWEYVDDMHNTLYNDHELWCDKEVLKNLNRLWKRYNTY